MHSQDHVTGAVVIVIVW